MLLRKQILSLGLCIPSQADVTDKHLLSIFRALTTFMRCFRGAGSVKYKRCYSHG